MNVVAITGGIACGKGKVSTLLLEGLERAVAGSVVSYDCDFAVAELLREESVLSLLDEMSDGLVRSEDGSLDKAWLREKLFAEKEFRLKVEGLLHPLVLEKVENFLQLNSGGIDTALVEVPLLFEVAFPLDYSHTVVVGASRETQIERLKSKRNLDERTAELILESQLPVQAKADRGDFVVWNDGDIPSLKAQVAVLSERIFDR